MVGSSTLNAGRATGLSWRRLFLRSSRFRSRDRNNISRAGFLDFHLRRPSYTKSLVTFDDSSWPSSLQIVTGLLLRIVRSHPPIASLPT